jgi:hypothetical protein
VHNLSFFKGIIGWILSSLLRVKTTNNLGFIFHGSQPFLSLKIIEHKQCDDDHYDPGDEIGVFIV